MRFLDEWLPKTGRVLDVGCGTGLYCRELGRSGRECLGIDLDAGMIEAAQAANSALGFSGDFRCDFQILDMADIGILPKEGFTGVYCLGNVLPHLPKEELDQFLLAVHGLLDDLETLAVPIGPGISCYRPELLLNVNRVEDLEAARELDSGRPETRHG